jgi:hypothetical protein
MRLRRRLGADGRRLHLGPCLGRPAQSLFEEGPARGLSGIARAA